MDIYGQDIALDDNYQARIAANGELILTDGVDTGVQDIRLQLWVYLGRLFYDQGAGSLLPDWIREESTQITRLGFEQEVERAVHADPRVKVGTAKCRIIKWDEVGIIASLRWQFIDETHIENFILEVGKNFDVKLMVKNARPRED